jgi:hypothetical protein
VDLANITSIQYFDQGGASLGSFFVGAEPGNVNQTFSFLGVLFNSGERVSRVRITGGNLSLFTGANESYPVFDLVAMDDFIYS